MNNPPLPGQTDAIGEEPPFWEVIGPDGEDLGTAHTYAGALSLAADTGAVPDQNKDYIAWHGELTVWRAKQARARKPTD